MIVFSEMYPLLENFHKSGSMGTLLISDWMNISLGLTGFLVIIMAIGMFWGGEKLEKIFDQGEVTQ